LKLKEICRFVGVKDVAPRAGAWIETAGVMR